MELKFLLLADAANQSREGKLNVAGEFNTIYGQQFPAVWPSMYIVSRIEAHVGEGPDHVAIFKFTSEDGKDLLVSPPLPVKFTSAGRGIPARADIHMMVAGLVLPAPGDYSVNIVIDGVHRGVVTLYVRNAPVQPAQGG